MVAQEDGNGAANFSTATDQHATMKELLEAVFVFRALPRLCNENQQQQYSNGKVLKAFRAIKE
jgi:hypothetical protein